MIYLQAPAGPAWDSCVASTLNSITCMGSVIFLRNAPVIKWNWDKGHCKAQLSSKCALRKDVNVNAIKPISFTASLPRRCLMHLCESWLTSGRSVILSNVPLCTVSARPDIQGKMSASLFVLKLVLLQPCWFMVYTLKMLPALAKAVPVLELMVSLPITCPSKSYWFSLEPSSATETDLSSPWVHR